MIISHQLPGKYAGHEHTPCLFREGPSFPTAADVLSSLQQTMEPAAGEWLTPIVHFAGSVPAFSGNILEVHFDKTANNVDFAARLQADYDKEMIAGVKRQQFTLPSMPAVFALLIEQNRSGFTCGAENIWAEYDAPFNDAPALFFDINRNKPFDPQAIHACLQLVTGASRYRINRYLLQFLEQVKRAGLHVVYYGLMFSRPSQSVRLTISGINAENLAGALDSLGWKGSYRALKKIRSLYLSGEQSLVVSVDIGTCLENRIGIEVFDSNQAAFIQTLYNNGHIGQAHFRLLSNWQQTITLQEDLRTALTNLHQRPVSKLYTRLNHFKFVVDDTETTTAKGYLYYCF